jgi:hypothetical protein
MSEANPVNKKMELQFSPSLQLKSLENAIALKKFILNDYKTMFKYHNIVFYKVDELDVLHIWNVENPCQVFVSPTQKMYEYLIGYIDMHNDDYV